MLISDERQKKVTCFFIALSEGKSRAWSTNRCLREIVVRWILLLEGSSGTTQSGVGKAPIVGCTVSQLISILKFTVVYTSHCIRPYLFSTLSKYESSISCKWSCKQLQSTVGAEAEIEDTYSGELVRSLTKIVRCQKPVDFVTNLAIFTSLNFHWMFLFLWLDSVLLTSDGFKRSHMSKFITPNVALVLHIHSKLGDPKFTVGFEINPASVYSQSRKSLLPYLYVLHKMRNLLRDSKPVLKLSNL